MDGKLRVGVVGLEEGLTMLIAPDRNGMEAQNVTVFGGCDSDPEKLQRARLMRPDLFYTQHFDELLRRPEIDIVAIYTPDSFHGEMIEASLDAGKHVICTKPLVNSMEDARRVAASVRRCDKRLMVGQSTRFFESFLRQRAVKFRLGFNPRAQGQKLIHMHSG